MNRKARTILQYVFSAVLTVGFLALAFRGTDLGELGALIAGANYWWLAAMFAALMVSHVVRAWRWRFILEPIKVGIGFRNLFSGVMIGYFMNNVLPRAGELVRPYSIHRLEGIPKSAALGTIVVERILDMLSFLVLVALLPLVYQGPLAESFPWLVQTGTIIGVTIGICIVVLVTLMLNRTWADRIVDRVGILLPSSWGSRLRGIFHSFLDAFSFIRNRRQMALIIGLNVVIWFLYVVMTYLSFGALDLHADLTFGSALVVLAISSIGVALPTPGSTGTYHFFTTQTLVRLFFVDQPTALGYATLTHATGFVGVTLIGAYFFLRDHMSFADLRKGSGE